jgi:hypothetical protein
MTTLSENRRNGKGPAKPTFGHSSPRYKTRIIPSQQPQPVVEVTLNLLPNFKPDLDIPSTTQQAVVNLNLSSGPAAVR